MAIVDKFSFALNKGYNRLCQPSEVVGSVERGLSVSVSYFSISRDGHGGVDVAKEFGFQMIRDDELAQHIKGAKKYGDKASLDMLDKVGKIFEDVRSGGRSIEDMNVELHEATEDFYQRYIAGERVTQTFRPMSRDFIPDKPEDPEDGFLHRRWLQKLDEEIGKENEIPHEQIRSTWGLD